MPSGWLEAVVSTNRLGIARKNMWPFKRRLRHGQKTGGLDFETLVARGIGHGLSPPAITNGTVEFLVLQVKDENVALIQAYLARAIDIVLSAHGTVVSVYGSFVLASFGFPFEELADASDYRRQAATELGKDLGSSARLLHGSIDATAGFVGTPHYTLYGPILTGFGRILETLLSLAFGEEREV